MAEKRVVVVVVVSFVEVFVVVINSSLIYILDYIAIDALDYKPSMSEKRETKLVKNFVGKNVNCSNKTINLILTCV